MLLAVWVCGEGLCGGWVQVCVCVCVCACSRARTSGEEEMEVRRVVGRRGMVVEGKQEVEVHGVRAESCERWG